MFFLVLYCVMRPYAEVQLDRYRLQWRSEGAAAPGNHPEGAPKSC